MSDGKRVSSRLTDPELAEALESEAEETGSKSEVVRRALREYLNDETDETATPSDAIPAKARDAHRKLVEWVGVGGRLELETAESVLANHLNIQKEAVRKTVIYRLREADAIRVHQGIHTVSLVVGRLDGDDVEARDPPASTSSGDAVADGGEARERLNELASAEVER